VKRTVYEDAPKMSLLDLGAPGNSLGDVYHFSAPLNSERGGSVTGELIGTKTLVKVPTEAIPDLERRATLMFSTFDDRKDQIIAFGVAEYSPNVPEFEARQPVVRAILGGTGKYIGARGQLTSTRNADGSVHASFHVTQVTATEHRPPGLCAQRSCTPLNYQTAEPTTTCAVVLSRSVRLQTC
jgi:hypothetical protein